MTVFADVKKTKIVNNNGIFAYVILMMKCQKNVNQKYIDVSAVKEEIVNHKNTMFYNYIFFILDQVICKS